MRTTHIVVLAVATLAGMALWAGADEKGEKKEKVAGTVHVVKMTGSNTFDPAEITIAVGDRVKWTNESGTHTATADDQTNLKKSFNIGTLKKDQEAIITFNNTGTIPYHCEYHAGMKGKIIVQ